MLSVVSRVLLLAGAVAFLAFGLYAFVFPLGAATAFPWRVGPFLAMTIGGWSIGTAAIALDVAYHWERPERTLPALVYVWLFGLAQAVVALAFADRLQASSPLAWPYLLGLGAFIASAVVGIAWLVRERPAIRADRWELGGMPGPAAVVFALAVLVLAAGNLISGEGGTVARGEFFPETMTLFSVRAFAAFFLAIGVGALAILVTGSLVAFRDFARVGEYLIVPVTLAALLNLGQFRFDTAPGHGLYLAAYFVVGALAAWAWFRYRHPRGEPGRRSAPVVGRSRR